MWWYALIGVVLFLLTAGWMANAVRLAAMNKNLARRSPPMVGHRGPEIDENNRIVRELPPGSPPPHYCTDWDRGVCEEWHRGHVGHAGNRGAHAAHVGPSGASPHSGATPH